MALQVSFEALRTETRFAQVRNITDFLARTELLTIPAQTYDLGEGISVIVQDYVTIPPAGCRFETHRRFNDFQMVARGVEAIEITPRTGLILTEDDFAARDIGFYAEPPRDIVERIVLRPGSIAIFQPEDAHKPRLIDEEASDIRKLVFKVPVTRWPETGGS